MPPLEFEGSEEQRLRQAVAAHQEAVSRHRRGPGPRPARSSDPFEERDAMDYLGTASPAVVFHITQQRYDHGWQAGGPVWLRIRAQADRAVIETPQQFANVWEAVLFTRRWHSQQRPVSALWQLGDGMVSPREPDPAGLILAGWLPDGYAFSRGAWPGVQPAVSLGPPAGASEPAELPGQRRIRYIDP